MHGSRTQRYIPRFRCYTSIIMLLFTVSASGCHGYGMKRAFLYDVIDFQLPQFLFMQGQLHSAENLRCAYNAINAVPSIHDRATLDTLDKNNKASGGHTLTLSKKEVHSGLLEVFFL